MNVSRIAVSSSCLLLTGCAAVSISDIYPYSSSTGSCYMTSLDMNLYSNICWDIGGELVLSPVKSDTCFKDAPIASVSAGTEIIVQEILEKRFGTWGNCLQMTVKISGIPSSVAYVPICASRPALSWSEDLVLFRGEKIQLRSDYVVECSG